MVLHNPNNWHWVNKDASAWAKEYFENNLIGTEAKDPTNEAYVRIEKVLSVDGDVDVSQRKGKVITLFDVKIQLEYSGKTGTGENVSGTITVPEVAHDTELDEYVFEISNYTDTAEKQEVRELARSHLTPQLRERLYRFSDALVEQHGKDIQHTKENDPKYKLSQVPDAASSSSAAAPGTSGKGSGPQASRSETKAVVNTTEIVETFEFQTTADELYQTLVDPNRITAFTRSQPDVFEPVEGGRFKLFGGNVTGEFVRLDPTEKITQKWRLANWPEGHYSTMTMVFDQGVAATVLRLTWKGVPIGQEETARKNFSEYYVRSIKITFGFGAIL
ncbi:hypothetical protein TWF106_003201 [Orbilia oligospora]|uniref:Activator of Hsp90 ATPase AHSA1-like N-terminal domain-containing protein n=1 Tax=Orbilia oligospora TaxID=2813651 RepID=A0A6G1LZK1_ORBOL|nr:hypothetical protein TWF788_000842 [Orbilia oligospora]KAF3200601.1 hypothetical protein TWF106_003201 [Orbilia oligospora]KAF3202270.1 hypothetical protein TWF191_002994 [Orbilia oligospora]KAF3238202.1 hypothetical protein TWF192_010619 [Orbilia oligospora]